MGLNESSGFGKIGKVNVIFSSKIHLISHMRILGSLFYVPVTLLLSFFRPPWGGVLVLTPLLFIGLYLFAGQGLEYVKTHYYVQDLHEVEPEKLPTVIEKIASQEIKGIPGLVDGLFSEKMSVALACRETLETQIKTWKDHSRVEAAILFDNLLNEFVKRSEKANTFQLEAMSNLCHVIQKETLLLSLPGKTDLGLKSRYLITKWEQTFPQPVIENDLPNYRYSIVAEQEENIGSGPQIQESTSGGSDPLKKSESREDIPTQVSEAQVEFSKISPFINEKLLNISREQIETLPTQDLMRLLNHPIWEIGQITQNILLERDRFSEEHVILATSLYHPEERVRVALLRQLAKSQDLELATWLSELLQDPSTNVRYETAYAICRGDFPVENLQPLFSQIFADKEPRIAQLVAPVETTARESRPPAR